jgi:hypothetical protein
VIHVKWDIKKDPVMVHPVERQADGTILMEELDFEFAETDDNDIMESVADKVDTAHAVPMKKSKYSKARRKVKLGVKQRAKKRKRELGMQTIIFFQFRPANVLTVIHVNCFF